MINERANKHQDAIEFQRMREQQRRRLYGNERDGQDRYDNRGYRPDVNQYGNNTNANQHHYTGHSDPNSPQPYANRAAYSDRNANTYTGDRFPRDRNMPEMPQGRFRHEERMSSQGGRWSRREYAPSQPQNRYNHHNLADFSTDFAEPNYTEEATRYAETGRFMKDWDDSNRNTDDYDDYMRNRDRR